jgi:hypothetical protein
VEVPKAAVKAAESVELTVPSPLTSPKRRWKAQVRSAVMPGLPDVMSA